MHETAGCAKGEDPRYEERANHYARGLTYVGEDEGDERANDTEGLHPEDSSGQCEEGLRAVSTMISEVYDALLAAGAPEDKARKAAEVLANYDTHFAAIEHRVTALDGKVTLLTWMVGFNLAISVAVLFKVFA